MDARGMYWRVTCIWSEACRVDGISAAWASNSGATQLRCTMTLSVGCFGEDDDERDRGTYVAISPSR